MKARDENSVKIAYQTPLYPMIDNLDTASSENNHGKIWNTRRNHFGWKMYLRGDAKSRVSPYAAPARQTAWRPSAMSTTPTPTRSTCSIPSARKASSRPKDSWSNSQSTCSEPYRNS